MGSTNILFHYQFILVTQSCRTLCDPMNHSTTGLPVCHQLPEFTQTHVHYRLSQNTEYILCARSKSLLYSTLTFAFFVHACSVTQLHATLWDPMDCSPPSSSVHGISQVRILEWVAFSSSRDLLNSEIESMAPALTGGFFTTEPPEKPFHLITFSYHAG